MADNFNVTQGTGTTIRAVEKNSKKTQVVSIDLGGAGAESLLTTTMPVSGTVVANLSATDKAALDAAVATLGATNGAAVITDADGTIQQFLRGLVALVASTDPAAVTLASGDVEAGALAVGAISDGADVTLGAKADNRSAATDTTAITAMQVLKQISYMLQNPAALAAGTAAIGKLAANSGVDIGDVDVTSMPVTHVIADSGTITAVTGITNAVAVTNAGITTLAGAVAGTEMQVDVLSLPTVTANATLAAETTKVIGTVNISASQTVGIAAGTAGIGKLTANSGVDIGDVDILSIAAGDNNIGNVDIVSMPGVAGAAADDAAVSGNPVRVGGHAVSALPAAVANNDTADLLTDLQRRLLILPYANPENAVYGNSAAITNNSVADVIAAQGAGLKIYVTSVLVTNSHATVGTLVTIQDDTAGTPLVICQGYAAALGGGYAITFPVPRVTGANQKLQAICGTTGSNVYVSASGFKAA